MASCFLYENVASKLSVGQMVIVSSDGKFAFGKVTEIKLTEYNVKNYEASYNVIVDTSFGSFRTDSRYVVENGISVRRTIPVYDEHDYVSMLSSSCDLYELNQDTMALIRKLLKSKSDAKKVEYDLRANIAGLTSALEAIGRGTNKFPDEMKGLMTALTKALSNK